MAPAPYNVMPRRKTSKFSTPIERGMTSEQRAAAYQVRSEGIVESVPRDVLDKLWTMVDEQKDPMVKAGMVLIVRYLERHHRRVEDAKEER